MTPDEVARWEVRLKKARLDAARAMQKRCAREVRAQIDQMRTAGKDLSCVPQLIAAESAIRAINPEES